MLKGLGFLAVCVFPLLFSASPAFAGDTLYLNSQAGDFIGGGVQTTLTDSDGKFVVGGSAASGGVFISFQNSSLSTWWVLQFVAPHGRSLAPGNYDGALRYPFQGPIAPGLDISGNGKGCNTLSGRFVVREVVTDGSGNVTSFAADFEQHCDGVTPALLGAIRFNSTVPLSVDAPTADAGTKQSVAQGATVTLDGSLSESGNGSVTAYKWSQLSGPSVTLADASAVTTHFTAPGVPLGGADLVFQLEVDNSLSLSSTSTVTIHVANPADPVTLLYMHSMPGDFIGAGQTLTFNPLQAQFALSSLGCFDGCGVELTVNDGASNDWTLEFAVPQGGTLQAGTYDLAQGYPSQSPTLPGLTVYGNGRGCNAVAGTFSVLDVQKDGSGNITSLALDFVQHCEGLAPALYGKIRYNSNVPLDQPIANGGPPQAVIQGGTVSLPGTAYAGGDGNTIVSYQWTQVSGPGVSLSDASAANPSFTAPVVPPGGADLVFRLTVTNSDGLVSTTTVTVHVAKPTDPVTGLFMQSDAGDYIGGGQTQTVSTLNALFTPSALGPNGVQILVNGGAFNNWTLDFVPASGQTLKIGATYTLAQRYPVQPAGTPGLAVYGDGRGCDTLTGQFTVLDLALDGQGHPTRFAAAFVQHCEGGTPALRGEIRFNSTVPLSLPIVDAGEDQYTYESLPVTLDGSQSGSGGGTIASYKWTQISTPGAPAVVLSNPISAKSGFIAPPVPPGGATLTFQLTVTNSLGLSSQAQVHVRIDSERDVKTGFYYRSSTADPVGQGISQLIVPQDASFSPTEFAANSFGMVMSGTDPNVPGVFVLEFAGPGSSNVQPGVYSTGSSTPSTISLSSSADSCFTKGLFIVRDIAYTTQGTLASLAVDFAETCKGSSGNMQGALRYHSSVPVLVNAPVAFAGPDQVVSKPGTVTLDGSDSFDGWGKNVSYRWTQLRGPTVTLNGADTPTANFNLPVNLIASRAKLVFGLTVTGAGARSSTSQVTIKAEWSPFKTH